MTAAKLGSAHLSVSTEIILKLNTISCRATVSSDMKKIVKLREREGQRVDLGRSLKGHLWMVDGGIPFPDALH